MLLLFPAAAALEPVSRTEPALQFQTTVRIAMNPWDHGSIGSKSLRQLRFVNQFAGIGICFQINVFVRNLDKTV